MRLVVIATGIGSYFLAAAVTFAVIRATDTKGSELAFVAGAFLGAAVAALMTEILQREPTDRAATLVRFCVAFAVAAVVLGSVLHFAFSPFKFPLASIFIGVIVSLGLPVPVYALVLDICWKVRIVIRIVRLLCRGILMMFSKDSVGPGQDSPCNENDAGRRNGDAASIDEMG